MDEQQFRGWVSGAARGLGPNLARGMLRAAELPYTAAMRLRNRAYATGRAAIHSAGVPVVSVGNLTLGGTGKTPFVCWLARWFRQQGVRVSIVSRGYGHHSGSAGNDEALELEQRLPDVPHVQDRNRVAAAHLAVEELETELIVLDDGFQHRRLARDLDIVLLDSLCPFGYDHVFPRGYLREPAAGLARAQVVALSRANLVDSAARRQIAQRAQQLAPQALWIETAQQPTEWITVDRRRRPLDHLAGERSLAFCALGNPEGFRRTLLEVGVRPAVFQTFPDHHWYSQADLQQLAQQARQHQARHLLCTHKDLVKVNALKIDGLPVSALQIEVQIQVGQPLLEAKLQALLESRKFA